MKSLSTFILVFILLGCDNTPIEPEPSPEGTCSQVLKINGVYESFCGDRVSGVFSQLKTSDSLIIYSETDLVFRESENYKAVNVAFATFLPDTVKLDYSVELNFFYQLIDLFYPESYHDLDINKPGGFAIEVWDNSGDYYSSEFSPHPKGGQIFVLSTNTYLAGPVNNQVVPNMNLLFESREPIILWNAENTKSIEVEFYLWYSVTYPF